MGGRRDFVSVIEAAYAAVPSEREWLEGIVEQAERWFDPHAPIVAYVVDASDPAQLRTGARVVRRLPEPAFEGLVDSNRAVGASAVEKLYATHPPVMELSKVLPTIGPQNSRPVRAMLGEIGVVDVLGIRGFGLDRRGVMLCPAFPTERPVAARTRSALARVARHLATAYRLREKDGSTAEATLTPTGRVEHAAPELRDQCSLSDIVSDAQQIGLARGKLRREEPERAVELWRALVAGAGRSSRRSRSDGKRFLLARRNELGVPHPRALTRSEGEVLALAAAGHSNSAVSYELGLSPSRVSRLLRDAMSKLGMRSRAELAGYRGGQ